MGSTGKTTKTSENKLKLTYCISNLVKLTTFILVTLLVRMIQLSGHCFRLYCGLQHKAKHPVKHLSVSLLGSTCTDCSCLFTFLEYFVIIYDKLLCPCHHCYTSDSGSDLLCTALSFIIILPRKRVYKNGDFQSPY